MPKNAVNLKIVGQENNGYNHVEYLGKQDVVRAVQAFRALANKEFGRDWRKTSPEATRDIFNCVVNLLPVSMPRVKWLHNYTQPLRELARANYDLCVSSETIHKNSGGLVLGNP